MHIDFGNQLRGENRTIANLTRPNSLFLSAAAQNNHSQLMELYRFFNKKWSVFLSEEPTNDLGIAKRLSDYEHLAHLQELIREADVGINDIVVRDMEPSEQEIELTRDLAELIWKRMERDESTSNIAKQEFIEELSERKGLHFVHAGARGTKTNFEYELESKGTRTLISLLIPALEALSSGALLVIDELDTSLHPDIARAFVSLFNKEESNPRGAQLLFSTHDVALLGSGLLLQDQIWMADKDSGGISRFTPLTEFKLRARDDFERAYRKGRLGGVPTRFLEQR